MINISMRFTRTIVSDGLWGYLLHDHERTGLSRLELLDASYKNPGYRSDILGDPEVHKALGSNSPQNDFISITPRVAQFAYDNMMAMYPSLSNELKHQAWLNQTHGKRAYTNRCGWNDGYADYITGQNLNSEPMKAERIIMGGSVYRLQSASPWYRGSEKEPFYNLMALNMLTASDDLLKKIIGMPKPNRYCHMAVISRRIILADGSRECIPFSQGQVWHVAWPTWSNTDFISIEAWKMRIIPKGESFPISPYNPPDRDGHVLAFHAKEN